MWPNPEARLADQCREVMRFRHLSARTEETYLDWDFVPERTRRQARWLMGTLVAAGVLGSAWEIVRAYQRALGG